MLKKSLYAFVIICAILFLGYKVYLLETVSVFALPISGRTIVIDAGHGGFDPGKVGILGTHEKNVNLAIAQKLQKYLEQGGANVIMTRIDDTGLHSKNDKSKKKSDMKNRKQIINTEAIEAVVSIHQNSFSESKYKGTQVFYLKDSLESKKLAELIQIEAKKIVDNKNERQAKFSESYYILKRLKAPAVIVECGFLSNAIEEKNLNNNTYQEKIAWAIYSSLNKYFDNK